MPHKNKHSQQNIVMEKRLKKLKVEVKHIKNELKEQGTRFGLQQDPKSLFCRTFQDLDAFVDKTIENLISINSALKGFQQRHDEFWSYLSGNKKHKQRKAA